jgi:hypothetical protein
MLWPAGRDCARAAAWGKDPPRSLRPSLLDPRLMTSKGCFSLDALQPPA